MRLYLFLIVAVIGNWMSVERCWAAEGDTEQAVRRYEEALSRFAHSRYRATSTINVDAPGLPKDFQVEQLSHFVTRDGNRRWRIKWSVKRNYLEKGAVKTSQEGSEVRIVDSEMVEVVWFGRETDRKLVKAKVDNITDADHRRVTSFSESSVTCGLLAYNGEQPLATLFRQSPVSVKHVLHEGRDATQLEAQTKWGYISVRLDHQRGNLPLQIVQRKGLNDWVEQGTSLSAARLPQMGLEPNSKKVAIEYVAEVDYGPGSAVGTTCTIKTRETSQYQSGERRIVRTTISISELAFDPRFQDQEFEITTKVPDGTPVTVEEHPNLIYEWQNGRVVKAGDPGPTGIAAIIRSRRWLLLSAVVIGVLALALVLWRRKSAARQEG